MSSPLTTHVLDTARGVPAVGVPIQLERLDGADGWVRVSSGLTDDDGRVRDLLERDELEEGVWCMVFDTSAYYEGRGIQSFYPEVRVIFEVTDASTHHHVPLLLSPFGYSTYRGS